MAKAPYKIVGPHMGFDPASRLGGERFESSWIAAMDDQDFQFTWLVRENFSYAPNVLPANHRTKLLARTMGIRRIWSEVAAIRNEIKQNGADLIRFHSVRYGVPVVLGLRLCGVRTPILFQHLHVEEPHWLYLVLSRLASLCRASFTSISINANEELIALGVPRNSAIAVQTAILDWPKTQTNSKQKPYYDFCYVGGLIARKRPGLLLKVIAALEKVCGPLKIAIIGRGDLLPELQAEAKTLKSQVDFLSNVDDQEKLSLLQRSKIFFFPSSQEGFGYAPLEAALTGTWVVSSAAGSLPEVLDRFPNAKCLQEDALLSPQLAQICMQLLAEAPPPAPPYLVEFWTSKKRFREEHLEVLRRALSAS